MIADSNDLPDERAAGTRNVGPEPAVKALEARSCRFFYHTYSTGIHGNY